MGDKPLPLFYSETSWNGMRREELAVGMQPQVSVSVHARPSSRPFRREVGLPSHQQRGPRPP